MVKKASNENKKSILYIDEIPSDCHITVGRGEILKLNIASFNGSINGKIDIDVEGDAKVEGAFADFSREPGKFIININLNDAGASCEWHLASLAHAEGKKIFETSVMHEKEETSALMSNYGIARDSGNLTFSGTSHIKHGAINTNTRQDAKIIVFDKDSDGKAMPILRIDENDVQASHAAVVGRLNEQHLFYLESRGISEENAKRIIALGYLKPIEEFFDDEEVLKSIDQAIEGGI
ncbi:MAG: SufD family Fe-S cluster assembly protein [Bacilli bacterium]|nr:SufD family Fe-S cluster assembly protein [Bacilli bacterium]